VRVARAVGADNGIAVARRPVIAEPQSRRLPIVLPLAALLGAAAAAG
jgi:hypothetical protein